MEAGETAHKALDPLQPCPHVGPSDALQGILAGLLLHPPGEAGHLVSVSPVPKPYRNLPEQRGECKFYLESQKDVRAKRNLTSIGSMRRQHERGLTGYELGEGLPVEPEKSLCKQGCWVRAEFHHTDSVRG